MASNPQWWRAARSVRQWACKRGLELRLPLRLPSAFITGSVGKTTTSSMLAHILCAEGLRVALATTGRTGLWSPPDKWQLIREGDSANCRFATDLLAAAPADAVVFELARGGLIKQGLWFDRCSVAAVLNIGDNHLGLDGIHTREDMAKVKIRAAQPARDLVVLNADDPLCLAMRKRLTPRSFALVSPGGDTARLTTICRPEDSLGWLTPESSESLHFALPGQETVTVPAAELPATLGGLYRPAAVNALFAALSATGLGVPLRAALTALRGFDSSAAQNPARMNVIAGKPWQMIVTTVDGPTPVMALAEYARRLEIPGRRLLVLTTVDDRADDFIRATGAAAAKGGFDLYFCAEYQPLRARDPLVAARLLAEGLRAAGVAEERILTLSDTPAAVAQAESLAGPGDLLIVAE
jgi:cyanophycin synthetase